MITSFQGITIRIEAKNEVEAYAQLNAVLRLAVEKRYIQGWSSDTFSTDQNDEDLRDTSELIMKYHPRS